MPGGTDLHALSQSDWYVTVAALRSAFFSIQAAARSMAQVGAGRIVVLVPAHSLRTSRGCGTAAIAGSFLSTVAQVAAAELGGKGVRVNVAVVGPLEGSAPASVAQAVPAGRLARPSDVAHACVLLASPEAEFVNGAVLAVDGGYVITKAAGGSPFVSHR